MASATISRNPSTSTTLPLASNARLSGSEFLGSFLAKFGLLRTPEELETPAQVARREELVRRGVVLPEDALRFLARHRDERHVHIAGNLPRPPDPRGQPDPNAFTAAQKLNDARSLDEALSWLTPLERIQAASDERLLAQLANLPDTPKPAYLI